MRMRPFLPLLLVPIAVPAAAAGPYDFCHYAADSMSCLIEQAEFAYARNAEATASVARVEARRARELALSLTHCKTYYSRTPRCMAERANKFAARQNKLAAASIARVEQVRASEAARNAEIHASLNAVAANRQRQLEVAQNRLADASIIAVNIERQRRFEARQNALATASVIRVEIERHRQLAISLAPCNSAADMRPRCLAHRDREFASVQNALATASIARVTAERERAFAAARNAEVNASIAAVARARTAVVASNISHCARNETTPRCEAERRRELQASLTHCKSSDDASPRCANERSQWARIYATATSHCARNETTPRCEAERSRELQASLTHCKSATSTTPRCEAERAHNFQVARNIEIDRSIAAVARERAAQRLETASTATSGRTSHGSTTTSPLETGALGVPSMPTQPQQKGVLDHGFRHDISADPCRANGQPFGPLHFTTGLEVNAGMHPELDRLAALAMTCPGMRIELHGYSDGTGSPFNRSMAQARAQSVADYLIAAGVAPSRLAAIGRGVVAPVLPYSKGIDRAYGRRVEFVIKDPAMDAAARRVMWDLAELLDPTYVPAVAGLSP